MKHFIRSLAFTALIGISTPQVDGSEWCDESDPDPAHIHILTLALKGIQTWSDDFYHAKFFKEDHKEVYYKSINFLGRVKTPKGIRHFFVLSRVLSSRVPDRTGMPLAKASPVLAWYDKDMKLLGVRSDVDFSADMVGENRIQISNDYRVFDLSNERDFEKVTNERPMVPEEDIIGEMPEAESGPRE